MTDKKTLFLIDGSAIAYRSHFAFAKRPLITAAGEHTGAVFGFCNTLLSILKRHTPDYIAVVVDAPGPTFRHRMFPEYKATREKMPDELVAQIPRILELVEAFNIKLFRIPELEADDIIGTYAVEGSKAGLDVWMVSGDKDFMQLINGDVRMLNIKGSQDDVVDRDAVYKKFNVWPEQIIDFLALMGDSSDNVPGVRGVGEKTAAKLIEQFGTVENLYENIDSVERESMRTKIVESRDNAFLSKKLVTIDTHVGGLEPVDNLKLQDWNKDALKELFKTLEFTRFLKEVDEGAAAVQVEHKTHEPEKKYILVDSVPELEKLCAELKKIGRFAVDTETTSLDTIDARLVGVSFSYQPGLAYFVPILSNCNAGGQTDLFGQDGVDNSAKYIPVLRRLLEDPEVKKTGQNIKYDLEVFRSNGIDMKGIDFDTMIASHLIDGDSNRHSLDELSRVHFKFKKIPTKDLIGTGKKQITMDCVEVEKLCEYACEDADYTYRLDRLFSERMEQHMSRDLFYNIEVPLIDVLADMEMEGICVNCDELAEVGKEVREKLDGLQKEIFDYCGEPFNVLSPQQVGNVLFEKVRVQDEFDKAAPKKKETGYSTDVEVLEKFSSHPLVGKILEYRQVSKLLSTYIEALPKLVNSKTGRIHTSFHQANTATGRLSSNNPNLQNIPIRTPLGRRIRKAFVPSAGNVLMAADYSQIELRVLAHFSGDEALVDAYTTGKDIHAVTASKIFGVGIDDVLPDMRSKAKTINFGIIYGMGARKLSRELGIAQAEAKQFIDTYFEVYPGVRGFIDDCIDKVTHHAYVSTLLGRKRDMSMMSTAGGRMKSYLEHVAVNTPVQGTAAEIIKVAMLDIQKQIKEQGLKSRMLLQVHDELVFNVVPEEVDTLTQLVRNSMESAVELKVPLVVNVGTGQNWLEAH